ncbi:MAG: ABC transporter ATP-binding protein [Desulfobacteraceae bacterium]|nr:MAG: ABC transporter ATP-binding protein [Desulfobacteraceae bacterium]
MEDILKVTTVTKAFGRLYAVNKLSFEVRKGEILGIMGPNGAGKTTVFNLITGAMNPDTGSILFQGREISKESPASRCRQGIGRTYQIPRPFDNMTVLENLLVGAVHGGGLREKQGREICYEILELIGLYHARDSFAGSLPLLDRKRLELGRALATRPTLILLDEIAGGLTEKEAEQVLQIVKKIWEQGITIVWIEHILMMMSEGTHRLLVIAEGQRLQCGGPKEVMCAPEVLQCYLGVED